MMALFSGASLTVLNNAQYTSRQPKCDACGLDKAGCKSPKMPVSGRGRKKILILGEAGGADEDARGRQFVGKAGRRLRTELELAGLDPDEDCWFHNAVSCFTGDVRVESPSPVKKVYRRKYSGPLFTVHTLAGRSFTGTPNHPILTPSGWVSLGFLNEGDDLVSYSPGERVTLGRADIKNPPPSFKEVFDSAVNLGDVQRVVGRRVDFHGDGENGDVDVVTPSGFLRDGVEASPDEHFRQFPFVSADEAGNAPLLQSCSTSANRSPNFVLFPLRPFPRCVGGGDQVFPSGGVQTVPPYSHGVPLSSKFDAGPLENRFQSVVRNAETVRQRLKTLPGLVTTDRVLKIERKVCDQAFGGDDTSEGTCHVYNLSTRDGYYIADGIVVSNCRPPGNDLGPHPKAVDYCRPLVLNAVRDLNPRVVLVLGGTAVESLVKWLWKDDVGGVTRWLGYRIPSQRLRAWVCPTYHPSFVEREESPLVDRLFRDHVRAAVGLRKRPSRREEPVLNLILDPDEAAETIGQFGSDVNRWVAFDFECNMLKPDGKDAEIICASMSDGVGTIAFPWQGSAVKAAKRFLQDQTIKKVFSNAKYEFRWTKAKLGTDTRGSVWDTMIAAHVMENANKTRRITSIKFQAFVKLGVEAWNTKVEPYLKSSGSNRPNRIRQFIADHGIEALLQYCALDSLYEWEVAMDQMRQMEG